MVTRRLGRPAQPKRKLLSTELDYTYKSYEKWAKELERVLEAEFGPFDEDEEKNLRPTVLDLYEQGVVVKEIDYSMKGFVANDVTEVIKFEKRDIPNHEFQVPVGYKKVDAQIFMELEEEE